MFPQEAGSKYKNIIFITGSRELDTKWTISQKGKAVPLGSPWTKRIRKLDWLSVFIKHRKITSNFKRRSG